MSDELVASEYHLLAYGTDDAGPDDNMCGASTTFQLGPHTEVDLTCGKWPGEHDVHRATQVIRESGDNNDGYGGNNAVAVYLWREPPEPEKPEKRKP